MRAQLLTKSGGKLAVWAFKRKEVRCFPPKQLDICNDIAHRVHISEIALDPRYQLPFALDGQVMVRRTAGVDADGIAKTEGR
jgi:hypothetical protein